MRKPCSGRLTAGKILVICGLACGWGRVVSAGPAQPAPVPKFSHILIVQMENKEFGDVVGNPRMPNFNGWARQHTLLSRYYAVTHPSLPNYLALVGGDTFGIQSDCTDCSVKARSLPDLLEAGGRSWKTYQESLPRAGFTADMPGEYAKKHNPFVYFDAIRNDPERCRRSVVPLTELAVDLEQGQLPDFAFIMPNLCHSGHDCGINETDAWLGKIVGLILRSPAFDRASLLVLTFDEGTTNLGCCGLPPRAGGGRIAVVLISGLVKSGFEDGTPYTHYSMLKTIAAAWGLEELGHAADPVTNLIAQPWREAR